MIRYKRDSRLPMPCPKVKFSLTFREHREEDLPLVTRLLEPRRLPELQERMRQGHFAVGAFRQDYLVAFTWANPNLIHEISTGLQFPLKPKEIYTYWKFVHPGYRNMGVSAQLDWAINRILAAK